MAEVVQQLAQRCFSWKEMRWLDTDITDDINISYANIIIL